MTSAEQTYGSKDHTTNRATGEHSKITQTKSELTESPAPDPSNPSHFHQLTLRTGLFFNGVEVLKFPVDDDSVTHLRKIRDLELRDDDVIITAYPKCGTHWVAEILHMLTTGKTEFSGRVKEYTMLEFVNDMAQLDALPSPRVLNSHLFTPHLPKQIVEKKVKMIHLIRNPKDVAVSMFHHLKQTASEQFTFDNFLKGYPSGQCMLCSHQFNYLRQMAEFEKMHPGHPILHVHYEDLKQDSASIIKELAQFVGVPASDDFCRAVASACGFSNMKEADETRHVPDNLTKMVKVKLQFYRKGIVGDWKNQFTVAQNEMFDEFLAQQKKLGYGYIPKGM